MILCKFSGEVSERDMDLLFLEEFVCSPRFTALFLSKIGLDGASVVEIEHSKMDLELGESDITVIVEKNGNRYGLLIEDKIDAIAMKNQSDRYKKRGEKGKQQGDYIDYFDFILAPKKYLEVNPEAKKYANQITYEECLEYFKEINDERSDFKIQQIEQAIDKQKNGYQVIENAAITQFWREYAAYQNMHYSFDFRDSLGPKGSNSSWILFHTAFKKIKIIHKLEQGNVDMEFSGLGKELDKVKSLFIDVEKEQNLWVYQTGKSAVIRARVEKIDCRAPFKTQQDQVEQALRNVEQLYSILNRVPIGFIEALWEENK